MGDALHGDLRRLHAPKGLAVEGDAASLPWEQAGNRLEHRRLPRAIGTDKGNDLTLTHRYGDLVQGL